MTTRLLPNALHFSEFQNGYHGTCGETALATALVCSTPQIEDTPTAIALMLSLTREMIGLGWAAANGSTTTQRLHDEAVRRKFHPDESSRVDYQEPLDPNTLHALLLSTAGVKPILLEVARASNLPGDEAGVQYHFLCIVGITDAGYICNDGDNAAISQHLITYSWAQIEAATPCGVFALELEQSSMLIPNGWHDDGAKLVAPNGVPVVGEIRSFLLATIWDPADLPVGPEFYPQLVEVGNPSLGTGAVQFFRISGQVSAVPLDLKNPQGAWRAFRTWNGQEEAALRSHLDAANQTIQQLQNQPAPAPAPAPAPLDPAVKQALLDAVRVLSPQVSLSQELQAALAKLP
jgi:hypothetical protein